MNFLDSGKPAYAVNTITYPLKKEYMYCLNTQAVIISAFISYERRILFLTRFNIILKKERGTLQYSVMTSYREIRGVSPLVSGQREGWGWASLFQATTALGM